MYETKSHIMPKIISKLITLFKFQITKTCTVQKKIDYMLYVLYQLGLHVKTSFRITIYSALCSPLTQATQIAWCYLRHDCLPLHFTTHEFTAVWTSASHLSIPPEMWTTYMPTQLHKKFVKLSTTLLG